VKEVELVGILAQKNQGGLKVRKKKRREKERNNPRYGVSP
jgi:hypothetical protein